MEINTNGKIVEVADNLTITELLRELKVENPEYVSVEHNGEILDRQKFSTTVVTEGDNVEFLYYMGGGGR